MKRGKSKRMISAAAVIFVAVSAFYLYHKTSRPRDGLYYVRRAVDGDTILLANGERVRYIGINTPETRHPSKPVEYFGKEASRFNKKLVEGRWVRLEFDAQKKDKYNRLLAYVYADGIFVNAKLVEEGYAQVSTFPPNVKHQELFLKLQREARENRRGLWRKE